LKHLGSAIEAPQSREISDISAAGRGEDQVHADFSTKNGKAQNNV
jgi:hypothetical protein